MPTFRDIFYGPSFHVTPTGRDYCYDCQYRRIDHGEEQRYVSSSTGKCKPLVVQAVHPRGQVDGRVETRVGDDIPNSTKLAVWLVFNPPRTLRQMPIWLMRWAWFTVALLWPFNMPKHTGRYPAYLSRYYGQLWAARSPREYSLRRAQLGAEPVHEITRSTHPRRLVIYKSESMSWEVCEDENIIKKQKYVVVSYPSQDVIPTGTLEQDRPVFEAAFITEVEAVVASLHHSAYWIDLTSTARAEGQPPEEIDKDVYRMADVYRGAEFTLIMLRPPAGVEEKDAWLAYGQRLWTFPEALLSRELRFKFRDGEVTPITLHQLANRAYAGFAEESAIINAYGLKDPLERLERLLLLKSALWRRTSWALEKLARPGAEQRFMAERVYALMGFFEHRIHPHFQETELQALVRLSMANDNDRLVERMVSLLPSQIPDRGCWYAEDDHWEANLWDIEPEIQVVGMTEREALVIGGCRATAIRWKNFPSVAFAMQRSYKRAIATFLPYVFWELFILGVILQVAGRQPAPLIVALLLMLFSPVFVAYGSSGRIVQAQPWLIGVKGLISAEEASKLTYGASISDLPRTSYSPSGTPLSQTETREFRRGDANQLVALKPQSPDAREDDDLYSLVDTVSATVYYFRAARPPTVCLYTGRESGMGRFVLCSEKCTTNELQKETVVRMPWYISQFMPACDWVAFR